MQRFSKKLKQLTLNEGLIIVLTILGLIVNIFILRATILIGDKANEIGMYQSILSSRQTTFMETQTEILERQTMILGEQNAIQSLALASEEDRDTARTRFENRDKINQLYDRVTDNDDLLGKVHDKVKSGVLVDSRDNLLKYVSEFEDIGALYCDDKVCPVDIQTILKHNLQACNNSQIESLFNDSKSGLAALCLEALPSSAFARYADHTKCEVLNPPDEFY